MFSSHNFSTANSRLTFILTTFALCLLLFIGFIAEAVYEGTANANMMIRRYERKGQFGEAALWREAAAKCLDMISIPMAEIVIDYCQRSGDVEVVQKMKAEIADTKARREEHLKRARMNREKSKTDSRNLDTERSKIDKFIAEWVPHYPDRFYQFGTYRNVFGKRIDKLKERGRFADGLLLEADASDMCARQYNDVTIRYFQDRAKEAEKAGDENMVQESLRKLAAYKEVRDSHLRRSAMLRALARQNPQEWPEAADKKDFEAPKSKRALTADKAIAIARKDERTRQVLEKHENVREFAWFQGFCWTVSYYTRRWESLAIIFVDDETGKVTDILLAPGDLEERENDEEEKEREEELRLSPEKVMEIAGKHPEVKAYLAENPNAKTAAAYNWRYNCWIIEVIIDNREIGLVTVSDKTGKILEVDLELEQ